MAVQKHEWVSERVLFGGLILVGYFGMGAIAALVPGLNDSQRGITRDVLMTIGPMIGIIVQAIWKVDKVDKINAETNQIRASKAPDLSPALAVPIARGAVVKDGVVTTFFQMGTIPTLNEGESMVTCLDPNVVVGWSYSNGSFFAPTGSP